MSEDEKKSVNSRNEGIWEILRRDCAAGLAFKLFQENNLAEMYRVINRVPTDLRTNTKLFLVYQILSKDTKQYDAVLDLLRDIAKDFEKITEKNQETVGSHFQLCRFFATVAEKNKTNSIESFEVLRKAVKSLNQMSRLSKNEESNVNEAVYEEQLTLLNIPAFLVKSDFIETTNTISSIEIPIDRTRAELSILQTLLSEKQKRSKIVETNPQKNSKEKTQNVPKRS